MAQPSSGGGGSNEQKEDTAQMEELLKLVGDYSPTVPEELISYYMRTCGTTCSDERVKKVIALATQKFIADIVNEAMQQAKIRTPAPKKGPPRLVLTTEDLAYALRSKGINMKKPSYFINNMNAK